MARRIYVTTAQKSAAKTIMKRDAMKGQTSRSGVTKIANARSAATGRYVSGSATSAKKKSSS